MNLFFEEDGGFKAGTVLAEAGNAFQVQLTTGRRTKIKQSHVFFSFESPAAADLITKAMASCAELDVGFLWEVAPEGEFSFDDLAREYWGGEEGPVERAALIFALHGNPVYFYRKGRGRYRRAPEDILKKALEALEKKRRLEELRSQWVAEMAEGRLPNEIAKQALNLLIRPDKNSIEWKALSDAASVTHQTPLRLMLSLGAIASPWRWHVESFYAMNFPQGKGFSSSLPQPPDVSQDSDWPLADVQAFSIDDSSTTEIDDATSVTPLGDGRTKVGIHIAAPALGIMRDDPMDQIARMRMSTVYAPGLKTTMLPDNWVAAYSLDEGRSVPCISLYATVNNETFSVEKTETRIEYVSVKKNLRYDLIDALVTEEAILNKTLKIDFSEEISWLWHFAQRLLKDREAVRGRPEATGRVDWFFALEGEGEDATIHVKGRRRGAPLDLLVAELMIFANSTWGDWLEEHHTAGIYRSQRMGRVRMSTSPGPHDGLGVHRYAWSTSPLRRYVDMVNQRQLISAVKGDAPAYMSNDVDLFTIVSQFDTIYAAYSEFQTKMDRYWSLRWIMQEELKRIEAIVVKGDLVRVDGLPFMQRIPGLPDDLPRGRKVLLDILGCDLVDLVMETRLYKILDETMTEEEAAAIQEELEEEEVLSVPEEKTEDMSSPPSEGDSTS